MDQYNTELGKLYLTKIRNWDDLLPMLKKLDKILKQYKDSDIKDKNLFRKMLLQILNYGVPDGIHNRTLLLIDSIMTEKTKDIYFEPIMFLFQYASTKNQMIIINIINKYYTDLNSKHKITTLLLILFLEDENSELYKSCTALINSYSSFPNFNNILVNILCKNQNIRNNVLKYIITKDCSTFDNNQVNKIIAACVATYKRELCYFIQRIDYNIIDDLNLAQLVKLSFTDKYMLRFINYKDKKINDILNNMIISGLAKPMIYKAVFKRKTLLFLLDQPFDFTKDHIDIITRESINYRDLDLLLKLDYNIIQHVIPIILQNNNVASLNNICAILEKYEGNLDIFFPIMDKFLSQDQDTIHIIKYIITIKHIVPFLDWLNNKELTIKNCNDLLQIYDRFRNNNMIRIIIKNLWPKLDADYVIVLYKIFKKIGPQISDYFIIDDEDYNMKIDIILYYSKDYPKFNCFMLSQHKTIKYEDNLDLPILNMQNEYLINMVYDQVIINNIAENNSCQYFMKYITTYNIVNDQTLKILLNIIKIGSLNLKVLAATIIDEYPFTINQKDIISLLTKDCPNNITRILLNILLKIPCDESVNDVILRGLEKDNYDLVNWLSYFDSEHILSLKLDFDKYIKIICSKKYNPILYYLQYNAIKNILSIEPEIDYLPILNFIGFDITIISLLKDLNKLIDALLQLDNITNHKIVLTLVYKYMKTNKNQKVKELLIFISKFIKTTSKELENIIHLPYVFKYIELLPLIKLLDSSNSSFVYKYLKQNNITCIDELPKIYTKFKFTDKQVLALSNTTNINYINECIRCGYTFDLFKILLTLKVDDIFLQHLLLTYDAKIVVNKILPNNELLIQVIKLMSSKELESCANLIVKHLANNFSSAVIIEMYKKSDKLHLLFPIAMCSVKNKETLREYKKSNSYALQLVYYAS